MSHLSGSDHAKHLADGVAAGARFRGEEAANVVRAVVALLMLGMHDEPWAALATGCMVLAVATLVRTGETRTALSVVTIGFDTTLLVWGIALALPDAAIVAMGVVGILLAMTRLSPALVVAATVHAVLIVRAGQVLDVNMYRPPATMPQLAFIPLPIGLVLAWVTSRIAPSPFSADAPPIDSSATYRSSATGPAAQLLVCAVCQGPVTDSPKCPACGVRLALEPPVDASRFAKRNVDLRGGRWQVLVAAPLGALAVGLAFVILGRSSSAGWIVLVNASVFVVAALLPIVTYARSKAAERGELLSAETLSRPLAVVLIVVLGISFIVLAVAALAVVLTAICSGLAFGIR